MSLPKSFTTVTPFSKALALSMLVVFPILGFLLGMRYQANTTVMTYGTYNTVYSGYPYRQHMVVTEPGSRLFWDVLPLLAILAFGDLVLKGYALWHAGKNKQKAWFIALFIINSLGILPLIYLLAAKRLSKKK